MNHIVFNSFFGCDKKKNAISILPKIINEWNKQNQRINSQAFHWSLSDPYGKIGNPLKIFLIAINKSINASNKLLIHIFILN